MNDKYDPDNFWLEREHEIGNKILFRTMVRIESMKSVDNWSLFYGTEKNVYFQFFKKNNIFSSLIRAGSSGEDSCHEIDISLIDKIDFIEPRKFLKIFNIMDGMIDINFRESVEIKNDFFTDRVLLVPIEKISKLKESFPSLK